MITIFSLAKFVAVFLNESYISNFTWNQEAFELIYGCIFE